MTTTILGEYQVEDPPLGSGTSGVVHRVMHMPTHRIMALKKIPVSLKEDVQEEVLSDLQKLYASEHPCIVQFHGVEYLPGMHCITVATEYMDKKSLKDVVRVVGRIPEQALGFCTHEILRGLVYLHRDRKVIHRDIKPSNLLVNSAGQCKISDFGLGAQLANTLAPAMTWVGSTTYMSPERISGLQYTWNSDIWSLGISLVECATGTFPYHDAGGIELVDVLDKIVDEDPPCLHPGEFSAEFCDFVSCCLRKRSENRPMAEMMLGHPWVVSTATVNMAQWLQGITV